MFRISPYVTHVECMPTAGKAVRLLPTDFEPKDFKEEPFARSESNPTGEWYRVPGPAAFAAGSNAYFSHAPPPIEAPSTPEGLLPAEQPWDYRQYDKPSADANGGAMYRARLAYAPRILHPNESAEYKVLSYVGPKERDVLAQAGGGRHRLIELIDLGFFAAIAKILV